MPSLKQEKLEIIGDYKIFISPSGDVIRIRTGERAI